MGTMSKSVRWESGRTEEDSLLFVLFHVYGKAY